MTILLTGATGFLGSNLLQRLISSSYEVVIFKRTSSNISRIESLLPHITYYDADIDSIEKPFQENKIELIIHTATSYGRNGEKVSDIVETNLMFALKLLETAVSFDVKAFFNTDTLLGKSLNSYSLSKRQFVDWLKYYSDRIKIVNLRLEHMYGPNDGNSKFVTWLLGQMFNNVSHIDLTKGEQKRDFIYIEDVVNAYIVLLEKYHLLSKFAEFDVGTGHQIQLKEFVMKIYDKVSSIQSIETKLKFGAKAYRDGELMEVTENIKPLLDLGWAPKVSIENGLEKMIKDYVK